VAQFHDIYDDDDKILKAELDLNNFNFCSTVQTKSRLEKFKLFTKTAVPSKSIHSLRNHHLTQGDIISRILKNNVELRG